MDFAKKQLEKYGWKEGQGLGKKEDGISKAIQPKLKFDNAGIGHNISQEFTDNWWNNIYQRALSNIEVNNQEDDVKMTLKNEASVDISTNGYLKELKKQNVNLEYGTFLKTAKLTPKGIVNFEMPNVLENKDSKPQILTDEELFTACGGRTAHKGARHGLKLGGKISRLEKQEKILLKKLQNVSLCDKGDIERKIKKITKYKDKHKVDGDDYLLNFEDDSRSSTSSSSKKHKKKKKRKSVSFSETVTEYHTQDLDSSVHSSDSNETSVVLTIIEKSKIKDVETQKDITTFDEGIEQDLESGDHEDCNHKSFEQAQCSKTERLSKAERKLKKKKTGATMRFLQEINQSDGKEKLSDTFKCKKCTKRKQDQECESFVFAPKRYCEYIGNTKNMRKKKKKKNKDKIKKKAKNVEGRLDLIVKSLDKVCKISDNLH